MIFNLWMKVVGNLSAKRGSFTFTHDYQAARSKRRLTPHDAWTPWIGRWYTQRQYLIQITGSLDRARITRSQVSIYKIFTLRDRRLKNRAAISRRNCRQFLTQTAGLSPVRAGLHYSRVNNPLGSYADENSVSANLETILRICEIFDEDFHLLYRVPGSVN